MSLSSVLQRFQKHEQYEVRQGFAQNSGILASSREIRSHLVKDGNDTRRDTCILREAVFQNGLTINQDVKANKVTVSTKDGSSTVFPHAKMQLPQDASDSLKIYHGPLTQVIGCDGALKIEQHQNATTGGSIPNTFALGPEGKFQGELVQTVPANLNYDSGSFDEDAQQAGFQGFYADDVGNHYYFSTLQGEVSQDGTLPIPGQFVKPTVLVGAEQLGNPKTTPFALKSGSYERCEFTSDGEYIVT
jgi:hypothetical protein